MPADNLYIFDACAFIAFLHDEPGSDEVALILESQRCLIHAVNLCETHYDLARRRLDEEADSLEDILLKAELRRISLADCFAMALALEEEGVLVTTDHREFDPIAEAGLCPIYFIR